MRIEDVVGASQMIQDIFKNEFLTTDGAAELDEYKIKQLLKMAHDRKMLNVDFDKSQVTLINSSANHNI